jgi:hypothetical protein
VSSLKIWHIEPSTDPIFPAEEDRIINGVRYYYNADPRARALACVDKTQVCTYDGRKCWSQFDDLPDSIKDTAGYWLLHLSLQQSTIYDAIALRLGTALLAQEFVSGFRSLPIQRNHWELEARQLFETSLARIQFDAWGIASGEDSDKPGYIDLTPPKAQGRLCDIYKFKPTGKANLNVSVFLILSLALKVALFIGSWRFGRLKSPWPSENDKVVPLAVLLLQHLAWIFVEAGRISWRFFTRCCPENGSEESD